MPDPLDLWQLPFARSALIELLLLSLAAGLLGGWVVLRRQAFFAHAAGAATFPGLVIAAAAGASASLVALAVALAYAAGVVALGRGRGGRRAEAGESGQLATALLLVAALAAGVVLASDVFGSGAEVDRLLFGTLLGLDAGDLALAGGAVALAAVATLTLGRTWAALGFDEAGAPPMRLPPIVADGLLLALIAAVAVAALPAVGALLTTALLVVPAATARLFTRTIPTLLLATTAIATAEAIAGLYLSLWLDAPPGPCLALLSAAVYLTATLARALRSAARPTGGPMFPARESSLFISPGAGNVGPPGDHGEHA